MTSVEPGDTLGENFTSYWVAPKYCFKGNVTAQPNFWTSDGGQVRTEGLLIVRAVLGDYICGCVCTGVFYVLCSCKIHFLCLFACCSLLWQWNYDRSFDDYVIADATDSGCVIQCLIVLRSAATIFDVTRTVFHCLSLTFLNLLSFYHSSILITIFLIRITTIWRFSSY